jgi:hypothetical protein
MIHARTTHPALREATHLSMTVKNQQAEVPMRVSTVPVALTAGLPCNARSHAQTHAQTDSNPQPGVD